MYPFGAYWFWMPPMRSSARGIEQARALEQQLPREQRAVQLALREDALGQRPEGLYLPLRSISSMR